jgi:hypothetical protein
LLLRRFHDRGHGRDLAAAPELKVFCFFSSEKKTLLLLLDIVKSFYLGGAALGAVWPHRPSKFVSRPA